MIALKPHLNAKTHKKKMRPQSRYYNKHSPCPTSRKFNHKNCNNQVQDAKYKKSITLEPRDTATIVWLVSTNPQGRVSFGLLKVQKERGNSIAILHMKRMLAPGEN